MKDPTAFILLNRRRSTANVFRGFSVLVDGQKIDKIKPGDTKKYALASGRHDIRVAIDIFKSPALAIDLRPGETLRLECGDDSPKTWGESLSWQGLEKSVKALAAPSRYLYVNCIGSTLKQIGSGGGRLDRPEKARPASSRSRRGNPDFRVFLSYRREDSAAITGRICDRLVDRFSQEAIFRDVDSIPLGADFRRKIEETIKDSQALLVMIGRRWLELCDPSDRRRLDLPNDPVRVEIESAMECGIPVIPVLVDEASMPTPDGLPASIEELAYRNAIFIPREPYFHTGVDKLIEELEALGSANAAGVSRTSTPFCTQCGSALAKGQQFCTRCGASVRSPTTRP
jgi:hypothetical protein